MWLNFVDYIFYSFDKQNPFIKAAHFFIYDTGKILFLLFVIIFFISLLRSYFHVEKIRDYLSGKSAIFGYIFAALFGIITPFCSCSAIPLFLGFLQARIRLGVTFSYLVSAPMNNEIAIAMLFTLFGWKVAVLYICLGVLVAIFSGLFIDLFDFEKEILIDIKPANTEFKEQKSSLKIKLNDAYYFTIDIIKKIFLYVIIGVAVGAFIHGYVPSEFIVKYASGGNWYDVPIATLLGIPMYSNVAGVMPLVEVLTSKGMMIGSALSFMMAITALSLPEAMILKRIISFKLITIFFAVVGFGIIFNGYLFNSILG